MMKIILLVLEKRSLFTWSANYERSQKHLIDKLNEHLYEFRWLRYRKNTLKYTRLASFFEIIVKYNVNSVFSVKFIYDL